MERHEREERLGKKNTNSDTVYHKYHQSQPIFEQV